MGRTDTKQEIASIYGRSPAWVYAMGWRYYAPINNVNCFGLWFAKFQKDKQERICRKPLRKPTGSSKDSRAKVKRRCKTDVAYYERCRAICRASGQRRRDYKRKDLPPRVRGMNKERRRLWRRSYNRKRYRSNPAVRLRSVITSRIFSALKRGYSSRKTQSTEAITGCTMVELKSHIEKQFLDGMSWSNHGQGYGKWNLDHIIPVRVRSTCRLRASSEHASISRIYSPFGGSRI
jgi:hypothetical protein